MFQEVADVAEADGALLVHYFYLPWCCRDAPRHHSGKKKGQAGGSAVPSPPPAS